MPHISDYEDEGPVRWARARLREAQERLALAQSHLGMMEQNTKALVAGRSSLLVGSDEPGIHLALMRYAPLIPMVMVGDSEQKDLIVRYQREVREAEKALDKILEADFVKVKREEEGERVLALIATRHRNAVAALIASKTPPAIRLLADGTAARVAGVMRRR